MPGSQSPKVPEGLRDLMKGLTKEILREKPTDLYEFSAQYFESIVRERKDFKVKEFEPVSEYDFMKNRGERNSFPSSLIYSIIPVGLTELIKDFIKAVLRQRPENICIFAVEYFRRLQKIKENERIDYLTFEKSKEQFSFTPFVRCTCGGLKRIAETNNNNNNNSNNNNNNEGDFADKVTSHENCTTNAAFTHINERGNGDLGREKHVNVSKKSELIFDERTIKAVYIIQKFCRRYIIKKKAESGQIFHEKDEQQFNKQNGNIFKENEDYLQRIRNKKNEADLTADSVKLLSRNHLNEIFESNNVKNEGLSQVVEKFELPLNGLPENEHQMLKAKKNDHSNETTDGKKEPINNSLSVNMSKEKDSDENMKQTAKFTDNYSSEIDNSKATTDENHKANESLNSLSEKPVESFGEKMKIYNDSKELDITTLKSVELLQDQQEIKTNVKENLENKGLETKILEEKEKLLATKTETEIEKIIESSAEHVNKNVNFNKEIAKFEEDKANTENIKNKDSEHVILTKIFEQNLQTDAILENEINQIEDSLEKEKNQIIESEPSISLDTEDTYDKETGEKILVTTKTLDKTENSERISKPNLTSTNDISEDIIENLKKLTEETQMLKENLRIKTAKNESNKIINENDQETDQNFELSKAADTKKDVEKLEIKGTNDISKKATDGIKASKSSLNKLNESTEDLEHQDLNENENQEGKQQKLEHEQITVEYKELKEKFTVKDPMDLATKNANDKNENLEKNTKIENIIETKTTKNDAPENSDFINSKQYQEAQSVKENVENEIEVTLNDEIDMARNKIEAENVSDILENGQTNPLIPNIGDELLSKKSESKENGEKLCLKESVKDDILKDKSLKGGEFIETNKNSTDKSISLKDNEALTVQELQSQEKTLSAEIDNVTNNEEDNGTSSEKVVSTKLSTEEEKNDNDHLQVQKTLETTNSQLKLEKDKDENSKAEDEEPKNGMPTSPIGESEVVKAEKSQNDKREREKLEVVDKTSTPLNQEATPSKMSENKNVENPRYASSGSSIEQDKTEMTKSLEEETEIPQNPIEKELTERTKDFKENDGNVLEEQKIDEGSKLTNFKETDTEPRALEKDLLTSLSNNKTKKKGVDKQESEEEEHDEIKKDGRGVDEGEENLKEIQDNQERKIKIKKLKLEGKNQDEKENVLDEENSKRYELNSAEKQHEKLLNDEQIQKNEDLKSKKERSKREAEEETSQAQESVENDNQLKKVAKEKPSIKDENPMFAVENSAVGEIKNEADNKNDDENLKQTEADKNKKETELNDVAVGHVDDKRDTENEKLESQDIVEETKLVAMVDKDAMENQKDLIDKYEDKVKGKETPKENLEKFDGSENKILKISNSNSTEKQEGHKLDEMKNKNVDEKKNEYEVLALKSDDKTEDRLNSLKVENENSNNQNDKQDANSSSDRLPNDLPTNSKEDKETIQSVEEMEALVENFNKSAEDQIVIEEKKGIAIIKEQISKENFVKDLSDDKTEKKVENAKEETTNTDHNNYKDESKTEKNLSDPLEEHKVHLTNHISNTLSSVDDTKADDVKADADKANNGKADDVKADDGEPEDVKANNADYVKADDDKADDGKVDDVKADDVESDNDKADDVKPDDVKSVNIITGKADDVKADDGKANDVKADDVKSNDDKAKDVKPDDVKADDDKAENSAKLNGDEVENLHNEDNQNVEKPQSTKDGTVKHIETKSQRKSVEDSNKENLAEKPSAITSQSKKAVIGNEIAPKLTENKQTVSKSEATKLKQKASNKKNESKKKDNEKLNPTVENTKPEKIINEKSKSQHKDKTQQIVAADTTGVPKMVDSQQQDHSKPNENSENPEESIASSQSKKTTRICQVEGIKNEYQEQKYIQYPIAEIYLKSFRTPASDNEPQQKILKKDDLTLEQSYKNYASSSPSLTSNQENETEFSDSLNEENFERDSLEVSSSKETDIEEDSLEMENVRQQQKQKVSSERMPTYLFGMSSEDEPKISHEEQQQHLQQNIKKAIAFVIPFEKPNKVVIKDYRTPDDLEKMGSEKQEHLFELSNRETKEEQEAFEQTADDEVVHVDNRLQTIFEQNEVESPKEEKYIQQVLREKANLNESIEQNNAEFKPTLFTIDSVDSTTSLETDGKTPENAQEKNYTTHVQEVNSPSNEDKTQTNFGKAEEPYETNDTLSFLSDTDSATESSAFTNSKDYDDTILSDENLNLKDDLEYASSRRKSQQYTGSADNTPQGGIYEIDSKSLKLALQTQDDTKLNDSQKEPKQNQMEAVDEDNIELTKNKAESESEQINKKVLKDPSKDIASEATGYANIVKNLTQEEAERQDEIRKVDLNNKLEDTSKLKMENESLHPNENKVKDFIEYKPFGGRGVHIEKESFELSSKPTESLEADNLKINEMDNFSKSKKLVESEENLIPLDKTNNNDQHATGSNETKVQNETIKIVEDNKYDLNESIETEAASLTKHLKDLKNLEYFIYMEQVDSEKSQGISLKLDKQDTNKPSIQATQKVETEAVDDNNQKLTRTKVEEEVVDKAEITVENVGKESQINKENGIGMESKDFENIFREALKKTNMVSTNIQKLDANKKTKIEEIRTVIGENVEQKISDLSQEEMSLSELGVAEELNGSAGNQHNNKNQTDDIKSDIEKSKTINKKADSLTKTLKQYKHPDLTDSAQLNQEGDYESSKKIGVLETKESEEEENEVVVNSLIKSQEGSKEQKSLQKINNKLNSKSKEKELLITTKSGDIKRGHKIEEIGTHEIDENIEQNTNDLSQEELRPSELRVTEELDINTENQIRFDDVKSDIEKSKTINKKEDSLTKTLKQYKHSDITDSAHLNQEKDYESSKKIGVLETKESEEEENEVVVNSLIKSQEGSKEEKSLQKINNKLNSKSEEKELLITTKSGDIKREYKIEEICTHEIDENIEPNTNDLSQEELSLSELRVTEELDINTENQIRFDDLKSDIEKSNTINKKADSLPKTLKQYKHPNVTNSAQLNKEEDYESPKKVGVLETEEENEVVVNSLIKSQEGSKEEKSLQKINNKLNSNSEEKEILITTKSGDIKREYKIEEIGTLEIEENVEPYTNDLSQEELSLSELRATEERDKHAENQTRFDDVKSDIEKSKTISKKADPLTKTLKQYKHPDVTDSVQLNQEAEYESSKKIDVLETKESEEEENEVVVNSLIKSQEGSTEEKSLQKINNKLNTNSKEKELLITTKSGDIKRDYKIEEICTHEIDENIEPNTNDLSQEELSLSELRVTEELDKGAENQTPFEKSDIEKSKTISKKADSLTKTLKQYKHPDITDSAQLNKEEDYESSKKIGVLETKESEEEENEVIVNSLIKSQEGSKEEKLTIIKEENKQELSSDSQPSNQSESLVNEDIEVETESLTQLLRNTRSTDIGEKCKIREQGSQDIKEKLISDATNVKLLDSSGEVKAEDKTNINTRKHSVESENEIRSDFDPNDIKHPEITSSFELTQDDEPKKSVKANSSSVEEDNDVILNSFNKSQDVKARLNEEKYNEKIKKEQNKLKGSLSADSGPHKDIKSSFAEDIIEVETESLNQKPINNIVTPIEAGKSQKLIKTGSSSVDDNNAVVLNTLQSDENYKTIENYIDEIKNDTNNLQQVLIGEDQSNNNSNEHSLDHKIPSNDDLKLAKNFIDEVKKDTVELEKVLLNEDLNSENDTIVNKNKNFIEDKKKLKQNKYQNDVKVVMNIEPINASSGFESEKLESTGSSESIDYARYTRADTTEVQDDKIVTVNEKNNTEDSKDTNSYSEFDNDKRDTSELSSLDLTDEHTLSSGSKYSDASISEQITIVEKMREAPSPPQHSPNSFSDNEVLEIQTKIVEEKKSSTLSNSNQNLGETNSKDFDEKVNWFVGEEPLLQTNIAPQLNSLDLSNTLDQHQDQNFKQAQQVNPVNIGFEANDEVAKTIEQIDKEISSNELTNPEKIVSAVKSQESKEPRILNNRTSSLEEYIKAIQGSEVSSIENKTQSETAIVETNKKDEQDSEEGLTESKVANEKVANSESMQVSEESVVESKTQSGSELNIKDEPCAEEDQTKVRDEHEMDANMKTMQTSEKLEVSTQNTNETNLKPEGDTSTHSQVFEAKEKTIIDLVKVTENFINAQKLFWGSKTQKENNENPVESSSETKNDNGNHILITQTFLQSEITYNSSKASEEVFEELCIKKSVSQTTINEIDDETEVKNYSLNDSSKEASLAENTEPNVLTSEETVQKMQKRRSIELEASPQIKAKSFEQASFDDPVIKTMESIVGSRESSAEDTEEIVIKNTITPQESFDYEPKATLKRLHTIAGDDPKALFKSVTIDETIKYIELTNESENTTTSNSSFCLDEDISANIRKKMMAYSLSEADSDLFEPKEVSFDVPPADLDVNTALEETESTSTETESTIVSAATKIQAGARGFLTRRRLRHLDTKSQKHDSSIRDSFGNNAISESLETMVENAAAKKIQKAYRNHRQNVDNTVKRATNAISHENSLAAKRLTLQRGDALRNNSSPEEEEGSAEHLKVDTDGIILGSEASIIAETNEALSTTAPISRKVKAASTSKSNELKWISMRQHSMPVQIDCEVFRVIPKHMRKRITSAEGTKKRGRRMQYD